jgi:hypothetical protein
MKINRRSALVGLGGATALGLVLPGPARAVSAGGVGVEAPFRMTRNRAWAGVRINGKEPLAFQIDTGSNFFGIATDAAARIGLKPAGKSSVQGAVGRAQIAYYEANELIIGGVMRQREVFLGAFGVQGDDLIAGVIPIAKFGAMGLDFERQTLLMTPALDGVPDGYEAWPTTPQGRGDPRSMSHFKTTGADEMTQNGLDQRPVVQGVFDGQPIRLMLDTGFDGALSLMPDYVNKRGLWDHYAGSVESRYSSVVRRARGRMARAEKLKIGRYGFARPVVLLGDPADRNDDGAEPVDGIIGMEILRRFNFINHADRQIFYIKPNPALGDGYRYDRAGLFVDLNDQKQVAVIWVREGGPAAKAGLKAGDKVTGWRGKDGYQGLMWALMGAPGTVIEIEVERDGARSLIAVTLEDLV